MRIALVATGGFDRSGRERIIPALVALVERLALAHDVIVYVLRYHDRPDTYQLAGATIRDLGSPKGIWRQTAALVRALRADAPFDVLHAYWGVPAGLATATAGRVLGVPVVVTCDSGEFVGLADIGYGHQLRLRHRAAISVATRLAARVTVCTTYQATLARAHGVQPEIIPLGVDLGVFVRRRELREGPPWRLLNVASINPVKDHETLLRGFSQLVAHGVDATLDIVGDDTLRGSVHTLAASLGVAGRVTFHGFLPSDALVPLYHAAHLAVSTSRHEAAGVVLLEAAACGVPVVGSRVGYIADWAPDAATAVPPRDPAGLADAIERLLAAPALRERTADAAHRWVRTHDADTTARLFESMYVRIAPGGAFVRKATV